MSVIQPILFPVSPLSELTEVNKTDELIYDMGHIMALDTCTLDSIQLNRMEYLDSLFRDNAQLLMNKLFSLPREPHPVEPFTELAVLPNTIMVLPREKHVWCLEKNRFMQLPVEKAPTKWEEFAKRKGIIKKPKSKIVYDEQKDEYRPRYGFNRANNPTDQWLIEHKDTPDFDPKQDPFEQLKKDKKARVESNQKKQMANLRRAGGDRLPGTIDLKSAKEASKSHLGKRAAVALDKKDHVQIALETTQRANASLGKFSKTAHNEKKLQPLKRAKMNEGKSESESNMSILNKVMYQSTTASAVKERIGEVGVKNSLKAVKIGKKGK